MSSTHDWMHPGDCRILQCLEEHAPEYAPLVATRVGMSSGYVQRRLDVLTERGFVTRGGDGVVYGVADRGERYLAATRGEESTHPQQ